MENGDWKITADSSLCDENNLIEKIISFLLGRTVCKVGCFPLKGGLMTV